MIFQLLLGDLVLPAITLFFFDSHRFSFLLGQLYIQSSTLPSVLFFSYVRGLSSRFSSFCQVLAPEGPFVFLTEFLAHYYTYIFDAFIWKIDVLPRHIRCLTSYMDFPDYFFLSSNIYATYAQNLPNSFSYGTFCRGLCTYRVIPHSAFGPYLSLQIGFLIGSRIRLASYLSLIHTTLWGSLFYFYFIYIKFQFIINFF